MLLNNCVYKEMLIFISFFVGVLLGWLLHNHSATVDASMNLETQVAFHSEERRKQMRVIQEDVKQIGVLQTEILNALQHERHTTETKVIDVK